MKFDTKSAQDTTARTAAQRGPSGTGKTLAAEVIASDLGNSATDTTDGNAVAIETLVLQNEGFETQDVSDDVTPAPRKR